MATEQRSYDHAESVKVFAEVAERSSRILGDYIKRHADGKGIAFTDEFGIAKAFMDLSAQMLANPWKLAETQMKIFWDYVSLWHGSALKMLGHAPEPVAAPAKGDNRFRDEQWENHFLFDYLKQSYLIAARHIHDAVCCVEGLPEEAQKKVNFFTRQYIDALAPSNFVSPIPRCCARRSIRAARTSSAA